LAGHKNREEVGRASGVHHQKSPVREEMSGGLLGWPNLAQKNGGRTLFPVGVVERAFIIMDIHPLCN